MLLMSSLYQRWLLSLILFRKFLGFNVKIFRMVFLCMYRRHRYSHNVTMKSHMFSRLEKFHLLSERLASVGIIEAQLRAPLKPLNTIALWWTEGFQGVLQGSIWCREMLVSQKLYVWSLLFFQSGHMWIGVTSVRTQCKPPNPPPLTLCSSVCW